MVGTFIDNTLNIMYALTFKNRMFQVSTQSHSVFSMTALESQSFDVFSY